MPKPGLPLQNCALKRRIIIVRLLNAALLSERVMFSEQVLESVCPELPYVSRCPGPREEVFQLS